MVKESFVPPTDNPEKAREPLVLKSLVRQHAATVPPSSGSKRHTSRSQKAQTASLASCQSHLYRADLHQMAVHRPIEATRVTGHCV